MIVYDNRIDVLDMDTNTIIAHSAIADDDLFGEYYYAEFSNDGSKVLITKEAEVVIWDWQPDIVVRKFQGYSDTIVSAVYSSNEEQILVFSDDQSFRIIDVKTGKALYKKKLNFKMS